MTDSPHIIWQDETCTVCYKPSGLASTAKENGLASLADWLIQQNSCYRAVTPKEGQQTEGGLCNRLDFETSGLVIAAKTQAAYESIRMQFSAGTVQKYYVALVEGLLKEEGTLTSWLYGRHRRSQKVSVSPTEVPRSREAILTFKPITQYQHKYSSLIEIKLITGLRHQIRAQLSDYGFPLLGDTLYRSEKSYADVSVKELPANRDFLLHAQQISFYHPFEKQMITKRSELPFLSEK